MLPCRSDASRRMKTDLEKMIIYKFVTYMWYICYIYITMYNILISFCSRNIHSRFFHTSVYITHTYILHMYTQCIYVLAICICTHNADQRWLSLQWSLLNWHQLKLHFFSYYLMKFLLYLLCFSYFVFRSHGLKKIIPSKLSVFFETFFFTLKPKMYFPPTISINFVRLFFLLYLEFNIMCVCYTAFKLIFFQKANCSRITCWIMLAFSA